MRLAAARPLAQLEAVPLEQALARLAALRALAQLAVPQQLELRLAALELVPPQALQQATLLLPLQPGSDHKSAELSQAIQAARLAG